MNDDDDLQKLWQSNQPEKKMNQTISLSDIRAQSSAFERKMKFRNVREYVAAGIVVVAFGWRALHAHSALEAAACSELVASAVWITFALVKSAATDPGPNATLSALLAFHRSQLDRQIKLLSHAVTWYLAPIALGLAALMTADTLRLGMSPFMMATIAIFVALFALIAILNKRAAAKLENDRALLPQDEA
ncbi:MAG: hypothetical protein ABI461_10740 [Polyangiaceae bacterium]